MQIDAWSLQGVFLLLNDSSWQHDGYYMIMKQSMCTISNNLISSACPRGNENNRHRASQLLKSGAMQLQSVQCKHCKSRLDHNLQILLFKIDVVPSMKSKVYNESIEREEDKLHDCYAVYLALDIGNNFFCSIHIQFVVIMTGGMCAHILRDFYC